LPDKDLVDLCHPIEPYQVTKNRQLQLSLVMDKAYLGDLSDWEIKTD
jgi:hypothetical protein